MYEAALTVGVFDMLHEGHINLLNTMWQRGKQIYVIVHSDFSTFLNKKRFPVQDLRHRTANLEALGANVTPCMTADPTTTLQYLLANLEKHLDTTEVVFVRGDDWEDFPGRQALIDRNVPIEYIPYTKGVSSTQRRDEL